MSKKANKNNAGKRAMLLEAMGNETMGKEQKLKKPGGMNGKISKKDEEAPKTDKVMGKKVHIMPKVEKSAKKSKKK